MDDLIVFLGARLDEGEAVAKSAVEWWPFGSFDAAASIPGGGPLYVWAHVTGHDPARALREVEAGRALIAEYRRALEKAPGNRPLLNVLVRLVRGRAAVWCDHPDYRAGWEL